MDKRREILTLSSMALMDQGQLQRLEEKYVSRTIKCVPDKFIDLCHMHLAFLLDLSDDKLEILLSARDEHKKKKSNLVSVGVFKKKEKPQTDLFGVPLTDEGVCLMIPLLNFLKQDRNICKEGLFRKPGNKVRMTALRELLIANGPNTIIDHEVYSPYDVACVLKEFLRELPEPLLTERHMEAHRQVTCLGKHARTPEEIARYDQKKLSALQLLMLLLPAPVQKMTIKLLRLLHKIGNCTETKMTPATLGTIFAPIFFIDRCVEASDLCMQISQMAPAVSFMIEKCHDLVHAPKELVRDLANYWNYQSPCTDNSETGQAKNGHTLNTKICYIDRELSRCDDIAGNTQTELANLFAHVQCLPNTPNNIKLKRHILKSTTTPVSSSKKHSASKSLTASIKKRLPSLGRSKNKQGDTPRVSNTSVSSKDTRERQDYRVISYSSTNKVAVVQCAQVGHKYLPPLRKKLDFYSLHHTTATPSMCELLESPAIPTERNGHQRPSRLRRRCQYTSENDENLTDSECTPPKQECRGIETCDAGTFVSESQVAFKEILKSKTCLREQNVQINQISSPKMKVHVRALSASPCTAAAFSPKNAFAQSVSPSKTFAQSRSPKYAVAQSLSPKYAYTQSLSPKNAFAQSVSPRKAFAQSASPRKAFAQSENEITYLPHYTVKKITKPLTPYRDSGNIPSVQFKQCKAPWTPVMSRAPLKLAHNNALETSI